MFRTRRHTQLQVLTAWVMGLVYVVAYLTSFAHDLEEQHVECPEHGHAMHISDTHDHEDDEDEGVQIADLDTSAHADHAHCEFELINKSPRDLASASMVEGPPVVSEFDATGFVPSAPIRGPAQPLYTYAPKTSPPATA